GRGRPVRHRFNWPPPTASAPPPSCSCPAFGGSPPVHPDGEAAALWQVASQTRREGARDAQRTGSTPRVAGALATKYGDANCHSTLDRGMTAVLNGADSSAFSRRSVNSRRRRDLMPRSFGRRACVLALLAGFAVAAGASAQTAWTAPE